MNDKYKMEKCISFNIIFLTNLISDNSKEHIRHLQSKSHLYWGSPAIYQIEAL